MCDVFRKTAEEARKDGNGEMVKEMEMSIIMAERAITKCNPRCPCEIQDVLSAIQDVLSAIQDVLLPKKTSEK